jgi:transcription elongation factor/antiterminator RfaH
MNRVLGALATDIQPAARWYAVNLRPQAERVALANLQRQGFTPFLPQRLKTIRHARQFRTVMAPLFPGYLFVSLDLTRDRWRSVNGTMGVVSLVMSGGEPRPVPRGVVEALVELSRDAGVVRFDHDLQVGQRIKMIAGPFADQLGTLDRLDDQGRVRVLLDMMGSVVPVAALAAQLAPA